MKHVVEEGKFKWHVSLKLCLWIALQGPWQVLRRTDDDGGTQVVHTQDNLPTLKQVALDILARR